MTKEEVTKELSHHYMGLSKKIEAVKNQLSNKDKSIGLTATEKHTFYQLKDILKDFEILNKALILANE